MMSLRDTTAVVACSCGAFLVMEWCLHAALITWLRHLFLRNKGVDENAARLAATQAIGRIIGALHNCIQIPVALIILTNSSMAAHRMYGSTQLSVIMISISTGYFWHDLITCLRHFEGITYLVHAALSVVVFTYALHTSFLHYYGAAFLMWEVSTFFVQARWLLYKLGRADSRLYKANGLAMLLTFFLCRNVFGLYISCRFWQDSALELAQPRPGGLPPAAIWMYRSANMALNGLNAFWVVKMGRGAVRMVLLGHRGSVISSDKDE